MSVLFGWHILFILLNWLLNQSISLLNPFIFYVFLVTILHHLLIHHLIHIILLHL